MLRPWIDLFRDLGAALFALFRAELAALKAELAKNGRTLVIALALFAAAALAGFWLVALIFYTLIRVAELWLPPWGAALAVTGAVLLAIAILALVGLAYLRRFDNPSASFQRRWQDHSDWWSHQLLAAAGEEPAAGRSGDGSAGDSAGDSAGASPAGRRSGGEGKR